MTLGVCYEKQPRFAGGAYHPVLRRTEHFVDDPLKTAIVVHEKLAELVLDLEEKVVAAVAKLKAARADEPVPALVRRVADQPAAVDQGRPSAGGEGHHADARPRREVQRRPREAGGPGARERRCRRTKIES